MAAIIIYIMGVSGSGKTTIGKSLAGRTGIPFFDGDDFHSKANKEKMKAGHPLDDDDRKDWLLSINKLAKEETRKKGAIIACSALKEKYRLVLSGDITVPVHWIYLQGDYGLISQRLMTRKDHFMPTALLQSQLETLEIPPYALLIDINKSEEEIVKRILQSLNMNI
jgi:carbohydrate kinase (thermoresistant glucokinase family)